MSRQQLQTVSKPMCLELDRFEKFFSMLTVWFVQTKYLQQILSVSINYTHRPSKNVY